MLQTLDRWRKYIGVILSDEHTLSIDLSIYQIPFKVHFMQVFTAMKVSLVIFLLLSITSLYTFLVIIMVAEHKYSLENYFSVWVA